MEKGKKCVLKGGAKKTKKPINTKTNTFLIKLNQVRQKCLTSTATFLHAWRSYTAECTVADWPNLAVVQDSAGGVGREEKKKQISVLVLDFVRVRQKIASSICSQIRHTKAAERAVVDRRDLGAGQIPVGVWIILNT